MTAKCLPLKRICYHTMNSWNGSKSLAYNLKIYNLTSDTNIRNKLYDIISCEEAYNHVNYLVDKFDKQFNYEWQAGFNGRSGGYLVLYRGGISSDGRIFSQPGKSITEDEVPTEVKKAFRKLALDIQKHAIYLGEHAEVEEQDVEVIRKEKVLIIN